MSSGRITATTTDAEIDALADEYIDYLKRYRLPSDRPAMLEGMQDRRQEARLIAAAPDLYRAGKKIVERWEHGDLAEAVRELDATIQLIEQKEKA